MSAVAHHGQFHPDTDILYGIQGHGVNTVVNKVDLHNGQFVGYVETVDDLHTLAWVHGPDPIPEPALLQLPILIGLSGATLWFRRRRR